LNFDFTRQVDWETHYLRRAATSGAILFGLAKEARHRCERAYAQTSCFELGEWKARHERGEASLVIGIESGFDGASYIRRRLRQDLSGSSRSSHAPENVRCSRSRSQPPPVEQTLTPLGQRLTAGRPAAPWSFVMSTANEIRNTVPR
jgi:hypothetical protein